MTIYEGESTDTWEDGMEEKEKIVLSDYNTKEEMHALMVEKGFQLRSEEEIEALKLQKQKEAAEEAEKKAKQREEMRIKREESRRKREEETAQKKREEEEEKTREDDVMKNNEL